MRSLVKALMVGAAAALFLAGGASRALAEDEIKADVPFKFVAEGKTYDAGSYDLRILNNDELVEVRGPSKIAGVVPVMTRLSDTGGGEPRLVFDKVGDTYYLSEVWLSHADGFLTYAAKGPHTHHVVHLHLRKR
jgi:hypothetical protein